MQKGVKDIMLFVIVKITRASCYGTKTKMRRMRCLRILFRCRYGTPFGNKKRDDETKRGINHKVPAREVAMRRIKMSSAVLMKGINSANNECDLGLSHYYFF